MVNFDLSLSVMDLSKELLNEDKKLYDQFSFSFVFDQDLSV